MGTLSHGVGARCDWLIIALFRALTMLTTAVFLVKVSGTHLVFWKPRTLWVRSLAGSFSLICNFYAYQHLHVADAITLMNVHPLWIVLITAVMLHRWPALAEILGVTCGLAGVVIIESPQLHGERLAAILALLSSASSAVAMLGLHRLRHVDPRAIVAHFAGVASLISATGLFLLWQSGATIHCEPSGSMFGRLLAIGASGTFGQILLTKAYAAGTPAKVATVGLVQVVFAMIFDVLLWDRKLTPEMLLGFALVLVPTTWLSLRRTRESVSRPIQHRVPESTMHD
jgi:drug/metabolite transporter (DMT)-like permease